MTGKPKIAVLDAGHGGPSHGCTNVQLGFVEKDWTLNMAHWLHAALMPMLPDLVTTLPRYADEYVDFTTRRERVVGFNPRFVLSIHVDWNARPETCGLQCYRLMGAGPHHDIAHNIGSTIYNEWKKLGHPHRHVKGDDVRDSRYGIVVTRPTGWTRRAHNVLSAFFGIPALLVECGFSSNETECVRLMAEDGKAEILQCLTTGVKQLIG